MKEKIKWKTPSITIIAFKKTQGGTGFGDETFTSTAS